MYLNASPRPAEEKGIAADQLELFITNIEKKKQKLEDDIAHYIAQKQHDLSEYEQTVPRQSCYAQEHPMTDFLSS
jgi:chaperonin GroEL (HSP60 family)